MAEEGDFLALDLGGTNFRVLHVRVKKEEKKVLKMDSQVCAISQEMMLGSGEQVRNLSISKLATYLEKTPLHIFEMSLSTVS